MDGTNGKKWNLTFGTPLGVGDTVRLFGWGDKGKIQKVSKYWWIKAGVNASGTLKNPVFTRNVPKLPMPNRINVLAEAFAKGGFAGTTGLLVGKYKKTPVDSSKYYGWLLSAKYTEAYKTLYQKGVQHTGTPRGFTTFSNGKPFIKGLKYVQPSKHNNRLIADLLALKLSITASQLGMTPVGFGELLFDDGGANPLNGLMVKEISSRADTLMSGYYQAGVHQFADTGTYSNLAATVEMILDGFEGAMDTVGFAVDLVIPGTRKISEVPFIHPNPGVIPERIEPLDNEVIATLEPTEYTIEQNYPNPFNPTTTIEFHIPELSTVTLKVFNMLGQTVATLIDREELSEGPEEVTFDATGMPSGIYFYQLIADPVMEAADDQETGMERGKPFISVRKMILLK
jgi:hypothetical protein